MEPRASTAASLRASPVLATALATARAAWPTIHVSDQAFVDHVLEKLSTDDAAPTELLARHAQDLYLACACSRGDAAAIAAFDALYFPLEVDPLCRRSSGVAADEIRQRVRAKLFVGPSPKIASYAGRSTLRTWLRAVVSRLVVDAAREIRRDVPLPEREIQDAIAPGDDPDGMLVKQTYQAELEAAFVAAAERLSGREKNLLRYSLAEGLTADQVGRIYRVHRVTATRWIQAARSAFVDHVKAVMRERVKLSESEFDSVVRLLLSRLDVTISRIFAGAE